MVSFFLTIMKLLESVRRAAGDLTPTTHISKVFTIVYACVSIGIFVALAAKLASALFRHSPKS